MTQLPTRQSLISFRCLQTNPLLSLALIAGAALTGAVTATIILRPKQSNTQQQISPVSSAQDNQFAVPQTTLSKEKAPLEAAAAPPSSSGFAERVRGGMAKKDAVVDLPVRELPGEATNKVSQAPLPKTQRNTRAEAAATTTTDEVRLEARVKRAPAIESVIRQRRIEPQVLEVKETNHDQQQKNQNRETNESPEATAPQDAREIRRVRDLFEGSSANNRPKPRRNVDRVTAIFEGEQ
ncbi:MAG: hypothetical protein WKF84_16600 [Pyrinomonadaceae bacterium]